MSSCFQFFTYKFLKQDFKVKEKDSLINATDGDLKTNSVGVVINIDESKNGENIIEISTTKDLPEILSVTKDEFVNSQKIIDAIRRFIESVIKGEKKYKATYEFLKKNYPKIKNIKEGDTIVKEGDFLKENTQDRIFEFFQENLDVVLSDMASNTTGNKALDCIRTNQLCSEVVNFSAKILKKKGVLISKLFMGEDFLEVKNLAKSNFKKVDFFKPESSRSESKETYIICSLLKTL